MILSSNCRAFHKYSLQICKLHTAAITGPRIGVLGVGLAKGQPKVGVETGPGVIRSTNFIKTLKEELGYTVTDYGDITAETTVTTTDSVIKNVRNPEVIGKICKRVSLKVQEILRNGDPVITLGGDHSIAIGTVHGHAQVQPDMCLIWVDAHSDINTVGTTVSGNMHGMSMSFHLHELETFREELPGFDWIKPSLRGKDVVYIGLRDVEPLERLILEKCGIKFFAMQDVDQLGISEVVQKALDAVNPKRNRPIHVSFDIDAYDVNVAPSTGTSVPGGLSLREGLSLAEEISRTGLLTGLDIVEVNTKIGDKIDRNRTMFAARQTILAFCGNSRGGNMPVEIKDIPQASIINKQKEFLK